MNIIKEIWNKNLQNFGYVIDMDNGGHCVVVLGEPTPRKKTKNLDFREDICRINEKMQHIYRQESLSVDDKIELANLMKKMYGICEARQEGIYTREEQATFIDNLSKNEKAQLEFQIQMLNDCRFFHRDYVFRP
ncbi:MAG: hypothetical protein IJC88_00955 [Oscillospiraceae bacterium]|nr:hypothetical protein [Oscillospiraceae bacterium]